MNMTVTSSNFRLATKGLIALAMTGVVLTLPGCGGGGSEGAPLNPSPSPSNPLPISVNPAAVTVYFNQPVSLLISGGVGPFRVFSSNPSILPVLQDVIGSTITISPNNVLEDTPVDLTITDITGGTTRATVTVKPSTVAVGNLEITPSAASPGVGCAPAVCSGQTAVAILTVKSATGTPLAGRQVRFDALQGQFNFTLDDAGSQLTKSITVTTDSTGRATVRLRADSNAATAFALIRATDVANGSRIDKSFAIAQFTDGTGTLSISPNSWKITGAFKGLCSGGAEAGFYIFGGTPPYRVVSSAPDAIQVGNLFGGSVFGGVTTVSSNGGYFVGRTTGVCVVNSNSILFVTDATGRTAGAGFENTEGSAEIPTSPPPAALAVSPSAVSLRASIPVSVTAPATPPATGTVTVTSLFCPADFAQGFTFQGGTGPYRLAITQGLQGYNFTNEVTSNGVPLAEIANSKGVYTLPQAGAVNITWRSTSGPLPQGSVGTVEIVDGNSNKVGATITCAT
jgi:hypothetical protein